MNRSLLAAILLLAAGAYGFRLGFPDFWGNHWESRRALIARTMLESGDYLVPRQNDRITLNKPPLYYWTMAAAMRVSGDTGERGARLPSAIAGVAGIALTARLALLLGSGGAAIWAAALLLGNVLYFGHARVAEMDLLLAVVELAALLAFLEARARPARAWFSWLGWGGVAAGFLIKGPVGVLVPVAAIVLFGLLDRREPAAPRGWIRPWRGLALFLALVLPWFVVVLLRVPDAWEIFRRETLTRYAGGLDHHEPFWFYLPVLAGGFLPGAQFWPLWFAAARRGRTAPERSLRALGVIVVVLVIFFSLSGSKRIYYVLPLWPLLAAGTALSLEWARREGRLAWLARGTAAPAAILGLAALGAAVVPHLGGPPFHPGDPMAWATLLSVAALGFWAARESLRGGWERGLLGTAAAVVLVGVFMVQSVGPVSNAYRSRRDFVHEAAALVPAGEDLHTLRESNFAYPFYARRTVPDLAGPEEIRALLAAGRSVHLLCGADVVARLRSEGLGVETLLEKTWTPPGRPGDARSLRLVRVLP